MSDKRPKVFLKKDHGFNASRFPLLAFAPMGGRDKFLRESGRDDVVFIAGTMTWPTPEMQRGRLLARVTVGHRPVPTLAVLESLGVQIEPHERNDSGEYRWPDGLPLLTVELLRDTPKLEDVFGNNLSGNQWATFAINVSEALGDDVADRLLALPTEPCVVPDVPLFSREATLSRTFRTHRRYKLTGPPPSSWKRSVGHELGWGAAYLLRLEGHNEPIWKIGKAIEPLRRCQHLSRELLPSITGLTWRLAATVEFESEMHAFEFEQALLTRLGQYRLNPEREIVKVTEKAVYAAWDDVLSSGDWAIHKQG